MNAPASGLPGARSEAPDGRSGERLAGHSGERAEGPTGTPSAAGVERCYHCDEPTVAATRRRIDFDNAERALCCTGCEAVMRAILDAGLADYYRHRTAAAAFGRVPNELAAALDALAVYDEPELVGRHVVGVGADGLPATGEAVRASEVLLSVEGMRCGACVWLLERAVRSLPAVSGASFNFSTSRARVRYDAARLPLSAILRRVASVGYRVVPFDAREREEGVRRESRAQLQRLFVAGIATMQVMMYALPAYLADAGGIDPAHEGLLRWASLLLTAPVMLYSARPFFAGAWRDLAARRPGMDVPVSIGLLAAFSASVHATLTQRGEIWFDSVAMFVFLLLGARWLEWQARRRALRAVDDIAAAAPETAWLLDGESEATDPTARRRPSGGVGDTRSAAEKGRATRVPAARLVPGDRIRVSGGERVPVDGRIVGDDAVVDLSLLSGESVPVTLAAGAAVPGGALVAGAPLELVVERGVSASAPSMIERLIERGAGEKPRIVRAADRVAVGFVTALLAFAALVFVLWSWLEPSRAATVAVTVLVVSCPCALSLATPAALAAATGRLLGERLVVSRGHAIETLAQVTDVVFDKTGTLTTGHPELAAVALADGSTRAEVLALAARLERGSAHPFGRALLAVAAREGIVEVELGALRHEAGQGVRGARDDGAVLRLGSARWCGLDEAACRGLRRRGGASGEGRDARGADDHARRAVPDTTSEVFLAVVREHATDGAGDTVSVEAREAVPLARFAFVDPPRPEAHRVVETLAARGLGVHLLSGDRPETAGAVAGALGIAEARGAATPSDKQAAVAALQAQGRVVLMVGDGINDAPVLALADVSLAVGDASALARTAADVISLAPGLDVLPPLLAHTRRAARLIRQNLAWAALYNVVAIPAAAFGLVPPWAAAIGMAGSSLIVAGNALRLSRSPASGR